MRQRAGDEFARHQLAEQDAAAFLLAHAARTRILLDLGPELLDADGEFGQVHAGLEVEVEADAGAVDQGLDGLAAELEAHRAFQTPVGEVDVTEFAVGLGAFDPERELDVLELDAAELLAEFGQRGAAVDVEVFVFRLLVALRDEGGQGREGRHQLVAELHGPAQPVAGRARRRVAQAARRHDQPRAFPFPAINQFHIEPLRLAPDRRDFGFGFDLNAKGKASVDEGVDDVGGVVRGREGAVAALDDGRHPEALEPVHDGLRGQIIEGGLDEIGLRADVPGERIPVLDIREIAPALAGDHHLAGRARHLLQHGHLGRAAGVHEGAGGVVRRHQPGRAGADHYNLGPHLIFLSTRLPSCRDRDGSRRNKG